ncbi:MAG: BREX-1 system phosphatase PglZ type A [Pseudanabaena sp.]
MNSDRIKTSIENIFQEDRRWSHQPYKSRRIVFWYDPEKQFQDIFDQLQFTSESTAETTPEIIKYQLGDNAFTTKYHLLIKHPDQNFLIYAPFKEPAPEDNWLIDIQLYSQTFSADPAAMLFADLNFHQRSLENIIRQHLKFFDSRKRRDAIFNMRLDVDTSDREFLLAMLSVLAGIKVANADMLLRQVLSAGLLESDNKHWLEFQKFNLDTAFWEIVKESTGFDSSKRSLQKLLNSLLISHLQMTLRCKLPESLSAYTLPSSQKAYAFIEHWANDRTDGDQWISLIKQVEKELQIQSAIADLLPEHIYQSNTFECIDFMLMRACVREIKAQASDLKRWQKWFNMRRTFIWCEKYPTYANTYEALAAAIELLEMKESFSISAPLLPHWEKGLGDEGNSSTSASKLFKLYTQSLYLADRLYRKFIVASDDSVPILREQGVIEYIENLYVNWFLDNLGQAWTEAIAPLQVNNQINNQTNWQLEGIPSQQKFFQNYVQQILQTSDREKVFVIISDAMRYEVASELKEQIAKELRGNIAIKAQLGILPSITSLGMAALLSGTSLEFSNDFKDVLRDGLSTQGSEARQKVLQKTAQVDATVISATDLIKMTVDEGREQIKPYRLIYIYHDSIDSIGDKPASERQVMTACEMAITELLKLVKRICNSLNGTQVFITADHGFLYQRKAIAEADKLPLPNDSDILKTSRRYYLQNSLRNSLQDMSTTSPSPITHYQSPILEFAIPDNTQNLCVVVPRGNLRFAKQGGGSQFVHGGASLQEICVPVISYHHKRAEKGDEDRIQKVGVQINARSRRVTNNRFSISILQTDPVIGRWRSRSITVALYDPQTNSPITDIKAIELNSDHPQPTEREFPQTLTVTVGNPPVSAYLIIRDRDDDSELLREAWTVSLAISNDFGDF